MKATVAFFTYFDSGYGDFIEKQEIEFETTPREKEIILYDKKSFTAYSIYHAFGRCYILAKQNKENLYDNFKKTFRL